MPGVRMRFLPRCNASLMVAAESVGLAMKKFSIGRDAPGVWPLPHVVPAELCWTAGTNTLNRFCESSYRYGASRVTGLVARVVYWLPHGKHCAGAPTTPENTWFQTPLVHVST